MAVVPVTGPTAGNVPVVVGGMLLPEEDASAHGPVVHGAAFTVPPSQQAATPPGDQVGQLQRLVQLREAGVLTEAEFTTAKAKVLQGP